MPTATFSVTPIGIAEAVVVDADLSAPMTGDEQAALRELFAMHPILVFRDQDLRREDQTRVMAYLHRGRDLVEDPEVVSNRGSTGFVGTMALPFHSDSAFLPEPISAISLHALDVTEGETSTLFVSGREAWRTIPDDLRARIEELHTLHVMPIDPSVRNRLAGAPDFYPRHVRKLVTRHPHTGDSILYLSLIMLDSIVELEEEESEALIADLSARMFDRSVVYEHRWQVGDMVLWDNIACLHSRDDFGHAGPRILQRASVGRWHFYDLYPEFPTATMPHHMQEIS